MNAPAKITSKGQVTVPKPIRELLNLKTGDRVEFVEIKGEIVLRAKNKCAVDLAGILGPPPSGETLTNEQIDESIGQIATENDARVNGQWQKGDK